jgi:CRISPR system Cascade subunit CasA
MLEPPNNLLDDAPLRAEISGVIVPLSLPALLVALSADQVTQLPGLQAHQEHAWFAFMVQVAAMALRRAGLGAPPKDAAAWRAPLLTLTNGDLGAWSLVRGDLTAPAFLQPPVPEGSISAWKNVLPTPDTLDLLVTAKNHDVKGQRIGAARPEHWIYALVSLQTMEGYSGPKNYGILRMNSGFGNRPFVARASGLRLGARFVDDVQALLETRAKVLELGLYQPEGGLAFAALPPWDGKTSLSPATLDPYFVECCRRVRLAQTARGVEARMAPSDCPRVRGPAELLSVGDPWTPINIADGKPLTVSAKGFHYSVVHKLLISGDFSPPPSMTQGADKHLFMAQALVRGQGKTEGLHERVVPIPPAVVKRLRHQPGERERLGELSKRQIEEIELVRLSVLRPALRMLLDGGESRGLRQDSRPDRWVTAFDQAVDERFFEILWKRAQDDTEQATRDWLEILKELARAQLELAIKSAPIPLTRRYKAISIADRVFEGSFRKKFAQQLKEPDHVQP